MFNEAQDISISGNVTNVAHRDQYNGATTIINRIVHAKRPGRTVVKRGRKRHDIDSEYDQYREIICGDIYKIELLSSEARQDREWKDGKLVSTHLYQRTIHQARVYGDDRVLTAISYHGRDAKKIWKEEFMKCSQANDPAVLLQLFAINRSKVPTLLFYDEWLPLGHLQSKMEGTFWEKYYLRVYTRVWWYKLKPNARGSKIWLNSRTGRISSGPDGPFAGIEFPRVWYNCEDMPSAMEMATADTCVRFFNQTGAGNLDFDVLQYARRRYSSTWPKSLLGIDSPDGHACSFWSRSTCWRRWSFCGGDEVRDFIDKLRLDTVYSGAQLDKIAVLKEGLAYTWCCWEDPPSDQTLTDSGLTQFQFNVGFRSEYRSNIQFINKLGGAWLSQVHGLDWFTSGLESCFIPHLDFYLRLKPRPKQFGVSDLETLPVVYLFLRPPPLCLADIDSWLSQESFWSFDKNGTSKIPETECERLGLPYVTSHYAGITLHTWPKYVYDGLHAWQVARGFDPATADFARSLGLPILEPAITRFESVVEEDPLTCSSPPEPDTNSIHRYLDNPFASNRLSPLLTPPASRIPQRQSSRKRKRAKVVIIHDTDSESEPESHQLSTPKRKRVQVA
ncbi:hypothetical protein Moror_14640 [Moniliophthora roreri MCA 2997]|uniref:Uncharacterized protein n=1 Tax=Moniliophthora roreri (strain MCA 2997) TaxID=1381753 RepID=V2XK44_MONRO|nr:hypothetical protein Moror_14640 [Moniliophthora roreri MCA 2997]